MNINIFNTLYIIVFCTIYKGQERGFSSVFKSDQPVTWTTRYFLFYITVYTVQYSVQNSVQYTIQLSV